MKREQWLQYLKNLPRFSEKPGIYREEKLLSYLGNPEKKYPVIHITGTNGKGSVGAMFAEVLKMAGLKVGLFSSPHLEDYPERIRIQGESLDWEELGEVFSDVSKSAEKWNKEENLRPTEFDFLTAAGFLCFAKENVDVAVVEVGLGGTFDSTNLVNPILTIITNVAEDHLDICGPRLEDLAVHKAGILKTGVPVVSGVRRGALREIIRERAKELGSPCFFSEESWTFSGEADRQQKKEILNFRALDSFFSDYDGSYALNLLGSYQQENASIVLAGLRLLEEKWPQIRDVAEKSLNRVKWPGRFEIYTGKPVLIIDGAHNPGGAVGLRASLDEWFPNERICFIVGFLKGKEVESFLKNLHHKGDQWIGVSPDSPRGMEKEETLALLSSYNGVWSESMEAILEKIQNDSSFIYVVCGSLYLVEPARKWAQKNI